MVLAFLLYLEFREEFPYVVNKKVNWQCAAANCNENPLDGYYDMMPRIDGSVFGGFKLLVAHFLSYFKWAEKLVLGDAEKS